MMVWSLFGAKDIITPLETKSCHNAKPFLYWRHRRLSWPQPLTVKLALWQILVFNSRCQFESRKINIFGVLLRFGSSDFCQYPSWLLISLWDNPWWRHQMETFSTLLVICVGNSPFTGEFPSQRPGTRSFHVFFDLRLNKRLSKQC